MGVNAALAERGTCARPTLILVMQNTRVLLDRIKGQIDAAK